MIGAPCGSDVVAPFFFRRAETLDSIAQLVDRAALEVADTVPGLKVLFEDHAFTLSHYARALTELAALPEFPELNEIPETTDAVRTIIEHMPVYAFPHLALAPNTPNLLAVFAAPHYQKLRREYTNRTKIEIPFCTDIRTYNSVDDIANEHRDELRRNWRI